MSENSAPAPVAIELMHRGPVTDCLHYGLRADCALAACAVPPAVAAFFEPYDALVVAPFAVVALFVPGRGWSDLPLSQQVPVSAAWAQGALAAGAVAARVGNSGIYADFQLAELA